MANDQTVYSGATYGGGVYSPYTVSVVPTTDTETVGTPVLAQTLTAAPAAINDPDTVGPTRLTPSAVSTSSITGSDMVGWPGLATATTLIPASLAGTELLGAPGVAFTGQTQPAGTTDTATTGTPGLAFVGFAYGTGVYGDSAYGGRTNLITPNGIGNPETFGTPALSGAITAGGGTYGDGIYGSGVYPGTNALVPATITDPDTVGTPVAGGAAGIGGTGYGSGPYGAGVYPGTQSSAGTDADTGWPGTPVYGPPLHLLGIGPWNPTKIWHGALNYGIGKGVAPARPHLQLPAVQSKSFTLRLEGGDEATASLQFARGDVVIVEEMATDLWWRRKDPRTNVLETIGRFNTSHNDLSRADDGTVASSLQFQDYKILLGNRMIMKYLTTVYSKDAKGNPVYNADGSRTVEDQSSIWPQYTYITQIMRFFIPADMGIDISVLDDDHLLGYGLIQFTLPPSNTIADTIAALAAIASIGPFEWWVDAPDDQSLPPKLQFAVKRGTDRGVVLVDIGQGSSPIASWQMRATSDTYANAIYFQGGTGGVITTIPDQITANGERDTQDSDNSLAGDIALITRAARKKLITLSDRRPTFTIVLAPGFWRGRGHIDVGDTVRIFIKLGKETLDYSYRVTEIQVDIDQGDTETVTLTLGNPLASANPRSQYSPITKVIRKLKNYEAPTGSDVTVDNTVPQITTVIVA